MKNDLSKYVHDIYPTLKNKKVRFTFIDGTIITGVIVGFYYDDNSSNSKVIHSWQITEETDNLTFALDPFGYNNGNIVQQSQVVEIFFFENNKTLTF